MLMCPPPPSPPSFRSLYPLLSLSSLLPLSFPSSLRELERERGKLERQKKKITTDIKKMAKTGQMVRVTRIVVSTSFSSLEGREVVRVSRWCAFVFVTVCAGGSVYHGQGPGMNQKLHQKVLPHEGQHPGHLPQTAGNISAQPCTQASCTQPGYEAKPGYSEP